MMKLYVGNLPYQASEADLQNWFLQAGVSVDSITLMRDRYSGEARGFGFAEVNKDEDGELAIRVCNGREFMGRALVVNEARPQVRQGGAGGGGFNRERRGGGGRGSRRSPRW